MLPDEGCPSNGDASLLGYEIPQLQESILVGTIAVYDHAHSRRAVQCQSVEPIFQEIRHSTHVDRNPNDEYLVQTEFQSRQPGFLGSDVDLPWGSSKPSRDPLKDGAGGSGG